MLEFDENRNGPAPRGSRRAPGRLCVLAILLLATAAGLLVRSRRGAAAHDGPSDWCGIGAAELSAALLDAGATRLSAWPALEKAVEKASGGQVTGAALPATFFGREFTRIPGCAWLVPADGMREFVHLLLGSGIRLRHVGLGYSGSILVDDASPELEGRPPHTGIFIDEDGGFAARFVPSDEWVRDATSRIAEPTVPQLAPLLQRAPDSPALLRYLASIADARAAAAIDARIAELTQRFPNLPAPLGDEILWRGSRTEGDGTIRHCFQVK
ncbi:MAG: hypothetical protein IJP66_05200, partial [Kiritimatiellae bacterium]|nr:hypothetical protein [Kiritimatiellia bacterium]